MAALQVPRSGLRAWGGRRRIHDIMKKLLCLLVAALALNQAFGDEYDYVYDPQHDVSFKDADVWKAVIAGMPGREKPLSEQRERLKLFYAKYKGWTPPKAVHPAPGKLRNLPDFPAEPRFPLTDKVWSANPGEASICLWEDDKTAAMSLGVDDNIAGEVPAWMELSKKYGTLNITWNLVVQGLADPHPGDHMSGTWDLWKKVKAAGYHIASHTMTHNAAPVFGDGWPGWAWECAESKRELDKNIPGQKTKMFLYGGTPVQQFNLGAGFVERDPKKGPNAARKAVTAFYTSARGGGGQPINPANQIDYFNIRSTTYTEGVLEGQRFYRPENALENCLNPDPKSPYHNLYRGWACIFTHFANIPAWTEKSGYAQCLEWYNKHRDELWTGFMDDVALYGQERDTGSVASKMSPDGTIHMTLTSKMDPDIFDYPLTVKVRLPASWTTVQAKQNGKPVPASIIKHESALYALVKALPDRGEIVVTK